jgi:hypothetical protein
LYRLLNEVGVIKSGRLKWIWHKVRMGEERSASDTLTGNGTGKIPVDKPRHRSGDNINKELRLS